MGKGPQSFNVHGPPADLLRHWSKTAIQKLGNKFSCFKTSTKCQKSISNKYRKHDVTAMLNKQCKFFVTRDATRVHANSPSDVTVNRINIPIADFES